MVTKMWQPDERLAKQCVFVYLMSLFINTLKYEYPDPDNVSRLGTMTQQAIYNSLSKNNEKTAVRKCLLFT